MYRNIGNNINFHHRTKTSFQCPQGNIKKISAKYHEDILGFSRQGELYNGKKWTQNYPKIRKICKNPPKNSPQQYPKNIFTKFHKKRLSRNRKKQPKTNQKLFQTGFQEKRHSVKFFQCSKQNLLKTIMRKGLTAHNKQRNTTRMSLKVTENDSQQKSLVVNFFLNG